MRKREREITLLYGMSMIRDDILNHPLPPCTAKDRLIIFIHFLMNTGAISSILMAVFLLIINAIP